MGRVIEKPVDERETVAEVKTVDEEEPVGEEGDYERRQMRLGTEDILLLQAAALCVWTLVPHP